MPPRPRILRHDEPALEDVANVRIEDDARVRLGLQRRARVNLQRELQRGIVRVLTLLLADLLVLALLRVALRDAGLLERLTRAPAAGLPFDYWQTWQFPLALLIALALFGTYGPGDRRRDARRLLLAVALAAALPLSALVWGAGAALGAALLPFAGAVGLAWVGLVAERLGVDGLLARVRARHRYALETLVVGAAPDCRAAMRGPVFADGSEYRPVGFVDLQAPPAPDALGTLRDVRRILATTQVEAVVISGFLTSEELREVVDASLTASCQLLSEVRTLDVVGVLPTTVWRQGRPVVALTARSLKTPQRLVKRVIDVVGATLGLVAVSPLLVLLAILIKLDSRGPILFAQERVGRGGRLFRIVKFRTMVDGADGDRAKLLARSVYPDGRLFKLRRDPRLTRAGRWLRRTSLDELPQLINVLRGEMSLVGPRPPLPSEVALYAAHHYGRFDVKPGMTGPWQVAGRNAVTDFDAVVALEQAYIRSWSLVNDLRILLRTIPAVLRMRGAL